MARKVRNDVYIVKFEGDFKPIERAAAKSNKKIERILSSNYFTTKDAGFAREMDVRGKAFKSSSKFNKEQAAKDIGVPPERLDNEILKTMIKIDKMNNLFDNIRSSGVEFTEAMDDAAKIMRQYSRQLATMAYQAKNLSGGFQSQHVSRGFASIQSAVSYAMGMDLPDKEGFIVEQGELAGQKLLQKAEYGQEVKIARKTEATREKEYREKVGRPVPVSLISTIADGDIKTFKRLNAQVEKVNKRLKRTEQLYKVYNADMSKRHAMETFRKTLSDDTKKISDSTLKSAMFGESEKTIKEMIAQTEEHNKLVDENSERVKELTKAIHAETATAKRQKSISEGKPLSFSGYPAMFGGINVDTFPQIQEQFEEDKAYNKSIEEIGKTRSSLNELINKLDILNRSPKFNGIEQEKPISAKEYQKIYENKFGKIESEEDLRAFEDSYKIIEKHNQELEENRLKLSRVNEELTKVRKREAMVNAQRKLTEKVNKGVPITFDDYLATQPPPKSIEDISRLEEGYKQYDTESGLMRYDLEKEAQKSEKQKEQERKLEKQKKEELKQHRKQINTVEGVDRIFKNLSNTTLMLNMSFLGIYFSFMGLFTMLQGSLSSIFTPLNDIGGTIAGGAFAKAFVPGATGLDSKQIPMLVDSMLTMKGLQGEYQSIMAELATGLMTDPEFTGTILDIFNLLREFIANGELKDSILNLFKILVINVPDILDGITGVLNVLSATLTVLKDNPILMKSILYSIIALPILSILNLMAMTFSAFVGIAKGIYTFMKAWQLASAGFNVAEAGLTGAAATGGSYVGNAMAGGAVGGLISSILGMSPLALITSILSGLGLGLLGVSILDQIGALNLVESIGGIIGDFLTGSDIGTYIRDAIVLMLAPITAIGSAIVGFVRGAGEEWERSGDVFKSLGSGISTGIEYLLQSVDIFENAKTEWINSIIGGLESATNYVRGAIGWDKLTFGRLEEGKSNLAGDWRQMISEKNSQVVTSATIPNMQSESIRANKLDVANIDNLAPPEYKSYLESISRNTEANAQNAPVVNVHVTNTGNVPIKTTAKTESSNQQVRYNYH